LSSDERIDVTDPTEQQRERDEREELDLDAEAIKDLEPDELDAEGVRAGIWSSFVRRLLSGVPR
jgi:hypothetical protein